MTDICRLVVDVELDGHNDRLHQSFSAHLYAELADGRRVLVLDDRGWGASMGGAEDPEVDIWSFETRSGIESTARTVVGPDEPVEGTTRQEAEDSYWEYLAGLARGRGVVTDAATLRALPMEVELSEQVLARVPD